MLNELIDLLKMAPSGGNNQPWVFFIEKTLSGVDIRIHLDKHLEFSKQATDHCGFGALCALGIMSHSIDYLCSDFGYRVDQKNIVTNQDLYQNHIFFRLVPIIVQTSQRPTVFRSRFTDRRSYEKRAISDEIKSILMKEHNPHLMSFTPEEQSTIQNEFKGLSLIRYCNQKLFEELSTELTTDAKFPTGIPIKNLGLSFLLQTLLKLQKLVPPISLPSETLYAWPLYESITKPLLHSGEVWCIKMPGKEPQDWISLGEKIMKIWLTLTENNIRLQPLGNTLIISNYYQDPTFFEFTPKHVAVLHNAHQALLTKLNVDTKQACLFFRLGYSSLPTQNTPRKNINTHFISTQRRGSGETSSSD